MEDIASKISGPDKSYLAFFDLDETIISKTSGSSIVRESYRRGIMGRRGLMKAAYLSMLYKTGFKNTLTIIHEMISWLAGFSEEAFLKLSSEVCSDILIPSIHNEVRDELTFHREQNAKVILLSSALKPICIQIADHLGMDDVICSELEVMGGLFTGRPLGRPCFEEEKAIRLMAYCKTSGADLEDTWYYGDSIADRHVLSVAGNPVCVNPDKKLRKIAEANKWKIYEWH